MRTSLSVFCFLAMVCVAEEGVVGGGWWVVGVLCVVGGGCVMCISYVHWQGPLLTGAGTQQERMAARRVLRQEGRRRGVAPGTPF